jgi:WD40 repeat protein
LFEPSTGLERIRILGEKDYVGRVSLSPDGKWLAVAGEAGSLTVWDAATGQRRGVLRAPNREPRIATSDFHVFSPNSRWLAFQRDDDRGTQLWDATTGHLSPVLETGWPPCIFSPDSLTLAAADTGGTVKLWDVLAGRERITLKGSTFEDQTLVFSPDGKLVAIGSCSLRRPNEFLPLQVRVWETETGELARHLVSSPGGGNEYLKFSPDNRFLLAWSGYGLVPPKLWDLSASPPIDLDTLIVRRPFAGKSHCWYYPAPVFSPDGRWLILRGDLEGTAKVLNTATLTVHTILDLHNGDEEFGYPVFSADGEKVALQVFYGAEPTPAVIPRFLNWLLDRPDIEDLKTAVKVFHTRTGQELASFPGPSLSQPAGRPYTWMAFAPDGKTLVAGTEDPNPTEGDDAAVVALWDVPRPWPPGWPYAVASLGAFVLAWALHRHWRRQTRRGLPQQEAPRGSPVQPPFPEKSMADQLR